MFLLSKLVAGLFAPATLLMLALAGSLALHRRRPGWSRALLGGALLLVAALSLMPIGAWLIGPLESRFPPPSKLHLDHVDGIIVLGGAIDSDDLALGGQPGLNDAGDRITGFVALARHYPNARLVWTGGSASVFGGGPRRSEADSAEKLFDALGVAPDRLTYERAARNTLENAEFTKRLIDPKPGETWLLVTSAWHMPRAVGSFRHVGWPVVAYPVDYLGLHRRAWGKFEAERELATVSHAVKEWIGLVSYRLLGRSDELLPGAQASAGS